MKKIKYLLIVAILLNSISACENVDFGDLNENKNGSVEPSTAGLLAGSIMSFATYTGRPGVTIPSLLVQYQSQVTYTDESQYAQTPYSWNTYYVNSLRPLQQIIEITSDEENFTPELLANGDPANQQAVALIFQAVVMKRVTDVYGDAPFTTGLSGLEDITPSYDEQETIYKTLIENVQTARDMIDVAAAPASGDLIYDGDMENWQKFANSFLMQMALQLSKVYPDPAGYAGTVFAEAFNHPAGFIDEVSEEAWFSYQDLVGFRNPWFANRTADYFLSAEFINALNGCQDCPDVALNATTTVETENPTSTTVPDPRKQVYARGTQQASPGVPYGYRSGSGSGRAQMSTDYYWSPTSSLPLLTSAYTHLNIAEAAVYNWITADAETMLEMGMQQSFESLSMKTAAEDAPLELDGSEYIAARMAQVGAVPILQIIGEEKWKALYGQAFDAWAEFRRTGYPNLEPAPDAVNSGEIPTRYLYPNDEVGLNSANYQEAVGRLNPGEDQNTARVWWDVD